MSIFKARADLDNYFPNINESFIIHIFLYKANSNGIEIIIHYIL